MSRGGAERGRHRICSRLQALSSQHRAQCGAWTHELQDHDLSQSRTLNWLSHPGTPEELLSWIEDRRLALLPKWLPIQTHKCQWRLGSPRQTLLIGSWHIFTSCHEYWLPIPQRFFLLQKHVLWAFHTWGYWHESLDNSFVGAVLWIISCLIRSLGSTYSMSVASSVK